MVTVNSILDTLDLSNVDRFKINGVPYPKQVVLDTFGDKEAKKVVINTTNVSMDQSHIVCDLYCAEDIEDLTSLVNYKLDLPNASSYISIVLDILI